LPRKKKNSSRRRRRRRRRGRRRGGRRREGRGRRRLFSQTNHTQLKEGTGEMLYLEHSFLWCCNLDTSESRSEIF